jgi:hypothetical protein
MVQDNDSSLNDPTTLLGKGPVITLDASCWRDILVPVDIEQREVVLSWRKRAVPVVAEPNHLPMKIQEINYSG